MKINCKVCNQPIRVSKFFGARVIECKHCGYIFDLSNNIILSTYPIIFTVVFFMIMEFIKLYLKRWIDVELISDLIGLLIILPIYLLIIAPIYQKIFKYFYNKKEWP